MLQYLQKSGEIQTNQLSKNKLEEGEGAERQSEKMVRKAGGRIINTTH